MNEQFKLKGNFCNIRKEYRSMWHMELDSCMLAMMPPRQYYRDQGRVQQLTGRIGRTVGPA